MTPNRSFSSYPPKTLTNFVGGTISASTSKLLPVTKPFDGSTLTSVVLSNPDEVDTAVQTAQKKQ
jgi:hypothetical protein